MLKNNKLNQYNEAEIKELIDNDVKLVFLDTGFNEVVVRYDDLPDIIVDLNKRFGVDALNVYDIKDFYFKTPIITTAGMYLKKCDSNTRKEINGRLQELILGVTEPKEYKVIDEDKMWNIDIPFENVEMER